VNLQTIIVVIKSIIANQKFSQKFLDIIVIYAIIEAYPNNIILWKAANYHIPGKNTNIFLYNLKNNNFELNY
jgi:hypothetical protein